MPSDWIDPPHGEAERRAIARALRRTILGVKLFTLVVWTLLCWGVWLILEFAATILSWVGAGAIPPLEWTIGVIQAIGGGAITVVWLIGAVLILAFGLAVRGRVR